MAHRNLSVQSLTEHALAQEEGVLSAQNVFTAYTGKRTGRSPKDRYIVKDANTDQAVHWGEVNQPIAPNVFQTLWARAETYLEDKTIFESDFQVGADPVYGVPVTVRTEKAWHHLFTKHMFITPTELERSSAPSWTLLNAAGLQTTPEVDGVRDDGAVMINFTERKILLLGMQYAGEMKKSMFSVLNFLLTDEDVLPMHCAANVGKTGDVALFFGLSGTGKTTLSADPERFLMGDDEHGWSDEGVFNFEGGCYAKCIDLSKEREPVIWNAIREGAIMENVVLDAEGNPDFSDTRHTKNTRAAYPRHHIVDAVPSNRGGHPHAVLFLCCDLYGVLPPVARLTQAQAAYYFLSGYTALVGSTEMGQTADVKPTFSTCFGAPFFPRDPAIYASLLQKRLEETGASVYLVNTGWTGGAYGKGGERFAIPVTRAVVRAILAGQVNPECVEMETLPGFEFAIPKTLDGVDAALLDPRSSWEPAAYQAQANMLIENFQENFQKFAGLEALQTAGPACSQACVLA